MPAATEPAVRAVARREAIAAYRVAGEPGSLDLQGLVGVAATLCGVPTAVINIIDDRMQHQIAAVGFTPTACSREDAMCAIALAEPGHTVVPDARLDPRYADNPFVNGEIASVRFYASSPLVTPAGVAIGTLCVFDTVVGDLGAEQRQALDTLAHQVVEVLELRRISRELQVSNQQLERFAAQVSHDLRNPLTALSGFLELAADSPGMGDAPDAARALARAEAAAERMAALIADLLSFARLGGASPRRERVPLATLVDAVLDDLRAETERSGASVVLDAGADLVGDPTLLRALLQNLVANAVKFTWARGTVPSVRIRSDAVPGAVRLTVDDNGPGVPEAERERVFELMERGSAQEASGLGIGLSTCRRIVDAHGGAIGIERSPAGGTRVRVLLPVAG